jgi:hypothetical protein
MPTGFLATQFSVTEEHGVLVTALRGPSTENDDFYLMLQHKDRYTEQDAKFGMNQPYIEYCGQGWSWYGHIEHFELLRDRVKVKLDQAAASHMGNDGLIEVEFMLNDNEFTQLRQALRRTFREHHYFTEEPAV